MHCTQTGALCLSSACASSLVHTRRPVAPGRHTGLKAVRVRLHQGAGTHGVWHAGLERLWLPLGSQRAHPCTTALPHPKARWLFLRECAPPRLACAAPAPACAPRVLHHLRMAFLAGKHRRFSTLAFVCQRHGRFFFPSPHGAGRSSAAQHGHGAPMPVPAAHWLDAGPGNTGTLSLLAAVDEVQQRW